MRTLGTATCIVLVLAVTYLDAAIGEQEEMKGSVQLRYTLEAKPSTLTIDRMPSIGKLKKFKETFVFTVTNTSNTEYNGQTPTSQFFDIEAFSQEGNLVWKWSRDRVFTQAFTSVKIAPGKIWQQTVDWEFEAAADGQYRAEGKFFPSGGKAETHFEIRSVH